VKQIITRLDDELADALKRRARQAGESVNSYVTRLLRVAVIGPGSTRQMWKAAAIVDDRLMSRGRQAGRRRLDPIGLEPSVRTPAGYAAGAVSAEREER